MTSRILLMIGFVLVGQLAWAEEPKARIAVYTGTGSSASQKNVLNVLNKMNDLEVETLSESEIRPEKLKSYQIVLFPGGSGSKQGKAIGEIGRNAVKNFVKNGGHYVGICAGSYLASRSYDWSLHILDAEVVDRKHWNRGYGNVDLRITPEGHNLFGRNDPFSSIYYHQGPLLAPGNDPMIPDYEALATFETEIAKNGAPTGIMKGTTAAARGSFGKGKVICFSPHPEKLDSTHDMLRLAIESLNQK